MDDLISILLVSNHRYLPGLCATMTSMIRSASNKSRLLFHIFYDDLTAEDIGLLNRLHEKYGATQAIRFHKADLKTIEEACSQYNGSALPWLRLFVADQIDADWVVYADVDTLWFNDVCKLWEYRENSAPLLWVQDMDYVRLATEGYHKRLNSDFDRGRYGCSGMMLLNIKMMRRLNLAKMTSDFIKVHGCPFYVDQDVLNHFFNSTCKLLPQTFLCMHPNRESLEATVLHCLGIGRMFHGPMRGWSGATAIWYRYYNKYVSPAKPLKGCGLIKTVWLYLFGMFYPSYRLYKFLTVTCAKHRAEQLSNMQFHAWLFAHSRFGR